MRLPHHAARFRASWTLASNFASATSRSCKSLSADSGSVSFLTRLMIASTLDFFVGAGMGISFRYSSVIVYEPFGVGR